MASKQIGKLRQRVGEIVSRGQTKTTFSDDFKELEADVQLRGAGLEKLTDATDTYIKYLEKKKEVETDGDGKLKVSPFEALGVAMIAHGSELGEESVYGAALSQFGRVHCKIATLQEDYATALRETYMQKLDDGIVAIQEYQALRKKLDSRRLALDTYSTKVSKAKKEKDRNEAEEEYEVAKQRYNEMSEEVQDRMLSIQKREGEQFAELTDFLETEMSFIALYHDALLKLKEDWPDPASANTHNLTHRRSFAQDPHEPSPRPSYEQGSTLSLGRKRANTSNASIPTLSRKRSGSLVAADTGGSGGSGDSANKADRAPSPVKSRKGSVSGWMGSLSRSRKNSSVSKKNFQSLGDNEEPEVQTWSDKPEHRLDFSRPSFYASNALSSANLEDTPSDTLRDRKPSNSAPVRRSSVARRPPTLKKIRAIHDMINHAPDELPFRTGDVLTVLDADFTGHVSDTMIWVRAEKEGFVGMVPFNYFEVVSSSSSTPRKPPFNSGRSYPSNGGSASPEYSDAEEGDTDSPSSSLLHDEAATVLVSTKPAETGLWDQFEPKSTRYGFDTNEPHPFEDPEEENRSDTRMKNFLNYDDQMRVFKEKIQSQQAANSSSNAAQSSQSRQPPPLHHASSSSSTFLSPPNNNTYTPNGRLNKTAPPSPVRPPAPMPPNSISSGRQLPQGIANAVAAAASGKKPPPPPPPARRAQSSANLHGHGGSISSMNGSVSSIGSGAGVGAREPPPPPPVRRPALPGRAVTSAGVEKSPFDP